MTDTNQFQRIEKGKKFLRKGGVAALYRPGLRFEEWQEADRAATESWIIFSANEEMEAALSDLTASGGYCHFKDPDSLVAQSLQMISELLFYRKAGFQCFAQGAFLTLLAQIATSRPLAPSLREVAPHTSQTADSNLVSTAEAFIRSRIGQPLQVEDLARHVGLSLSTFAHRYRAIAAETPYRTIVRLKMEAAKRLMIEQNVSVKETAARLGFSSEFHFSRCFRRMEGQPPSAHIQAMNIKA